jgi:hypothetical protein
VWFQNNGRRTNTGVELSLQKKVTLQEVIGRDYKTEITALASEMAGGAKNGSKEAFGNYRKALKSVMDSLPEDAMADAEVERKKWESEGKPDEVKIRFVKRCLPCRERLTLSIRNVEKNGKKMFRATAEMQFNEFGVRGITWEYHDNKAGVKLYEWYVLPKSP